jgi:hypothetical protein
MLPRQKTFLAGERGRFIGQACAPFALAVGTRSIPVFGQGDTFQWFPPCGRDRVVATLRGTSTFDRPRVHSAQPMAMHKLETGCNPVLISLKEEGVG